MRRAAILALAALACVLAGAAAFALADHVSFWLASYWGFSTASTVGYGDVAPQTGTARVIAVVMMLTALPLLAAAFASFTAVHVHRHVSDRLDEHAEQVRAHVDRALAGRPQADDEGKEEPS